MRPQQLPLGSVPLLGQQRQPQQRPANMNAGVQQLAMRIYADLALAYFEDMPESGIEAESLRNAASNAVQAAKCYFQAIGAIPLEETPNET